MNHLTKIIYASNIIYAYITIVVIPLTTLQFHFVSLRSCLVHIKVRANMRFQGKVKFPCIWVIFCSQNCTQKEFDSQYLGELG